MGQHGGVVLSTVSSQQEGPGVKSPIWRGLFCMGQASNITLVGFG